MARGWMSRAWRSLDHDPEIDVWKTVWRDQGKLKQSDLAMVAGLSTQTVKKMFANETKRPQHLTYAKLAKALGKKYALVDDVPVDYAKEVPLAREEYREHLKSLASARLVDEVTRRKQEARKKKTKG